MTNKSNKRINRTNYDEDGVRKVSKKDVLRDQEKKSNRNFDNAIKSKDVSRFVEDDDDDEDDFFDINNDWIEWDRDYND